MVSSSLCRICLPVISIYFLDKNEESLPLLHLSSQFDLIQEPAIANKTNGSKFREELNLMSFKLLAKSPNLRLPVPNFLTIQNTYIIKNSLDRFHCWYVLVLLTHQLH